VQQDARTNNCGWFAMKVLIDHITGRSFVDATSFRYPKKEKEIDEFKKKFPPFKYL
jgi:hypothetical protein